MDVRPSILITITNVSLGYARHPFTIKHKQYFFVLALRYNVIFDVLDYRKKC